MATRRSRAVKAKVTSRTTNEEFKVPNKKIPRNPNFLDVQAKTDTGFNAGRQAERLEYIRSHYRFKKGELFKRISCRTFVELLVETSPGAGQADFWSQEQETAAGAAAASAAAAAAYGGSGGGRADGKTTASQAASGVERPHIRKAAPTGFLGVISGYGVVDDGSVEESASASVKSKLAASASKLISVMHGVGELDIKDGSAAPKGPPLPPFLVLDLRDDVAFAKSHIRGALHFPISRLSRAQNYYLPEMHAYINTLGKAIVLYDDDERVAIKAATTFVERGVDNGFVLSGGLNVMNDRFPSQQMMWQVGESEEDSFLALTAENLALLRNHIQEMGPPTMSSRGSSRATSRSVSRSTTQSTARGGPRARKGRP